ncbi:MAG: alpha/beta fold hydrolase [Marinovum sp.]|nr:alpha/beta fold hydrolase [Marinovum sp.]
MTQNFDFHCSDTGVPILFVPGSYSTPAAWRPVQSLLPEGFEFFSTSLSGYGQSRERRRNEDQSLRPQIDLLSEVIEKIGKPVHLVAHSFGGLVALGFLETAPKTRFKRHVFRGQSFGSFKDRRRQQSGRRSLADNHAVSGAGHRQRP